MKALVCEKCGAPLESSHCKYCGTRYLLDDNNGMAELERRLNNAKMEAAVNSQIQAVISVAYDGSQSLASYYNQLMGNGYCSCISNQLMALDTNVNLKKLEVYDNGKSKISYRRCNRD